MHRQLLLGVYLLQVEAQIQQLCSYQSVLVERKAKLLRQMAAEQRAPKADWLHGSFEWDADAMSVLQSVFGIHTFRSVCNCA